MNILNNFINIKSKFSITNDNNYNINNNDYIEKYLKKYFNHNDINEIFLNGVIDNNIIIKDTYDLFIKYKNIFNRCFENIITNNSSFLLLYKKLYPRRNELNNNIETLKYKHPKDFFIINMWECLDPLIKKSVKENINNIIINNDIVNINNNNNDNNSINDFINYKNKIIYFLNNKIDNIYLNGTFYMLIICDIIISFNKQLVIEIYTINKEYVKTLKNNEFTLYSRTFILIKEFDKTITYKMNKL